MKKYLFIGAMQICCLLLTCFITKNVHGQTKEDLLKVYDSATIHSVGKFYIKGGNKLHFADLQNEFSSDFTKDLYKKANVKVDIDFIMIA